MAAWIYFHFMYVLYTVILFSYVIDQPINAFTFKIIHRYAPESPFYNANITDKEIVERLHFQTRSRKQRTNFTNSIGEGSGTLLNPQTIRPSFGFESPPLSTFLVKVSLGTFSDEEPSHKSYYLDLDTGSTITWLQCEDCKKRRNHCYRQTELPFPNRRSSSYKPLPCGRHPLCFPDECIKGSCSYEIVYNDVSYSIGILARENFVFPTSTTHDEIIPLVFGCGIDNKRSYGGYRDLQMAGIFGLGWGRRSFVTQINSISQGRFSYCLPPVSQAVQGLHGFLRFGSDIPSYSTLSTTRLIKFKDEGSYHVKLLDISINDARLNIPLWYFLKTGPDTGGCNFDTGAAASRVSSRAYQMVRNAMETYIARYITSLEMIEGMFGYDLCYRASKPFREHSNLPSVTFHFEGDNADFVIKPEIAFERNAHDFHYEYICLAMVPAQMTVIGSNAQANQFIVYDLPNRKMYFGPRDCSRNL